MNFYYQHTGEFAALFTAFFSFVILSERLTMMHGLGMLLTLCGISMAIFGRNGKGERLSLKLAPRGILYALGGALGQALGEEKVTLPELIGALVSVGGVALFFM
jgi:drug/metabolite transporter (DMT)-like permease